MSRGIPPQREFINRKYCTVDRQPCYARTNCSPHTTRTRTTTLTVLGPDGFAADKKCRFFRRTTVSPRVADNKKRVYCWLSLPRYSAQIFLLQCMCLAEREGNLLHAFSIVFAEFFRFLLCKKPNGVSRRCLPFGGGGVCHKWKERGMERSSMEYERDLQRKKKRVGMLPGPMSNLETVNIAAISQWKVELTCRKKNSPFAKSISFDLLIPLNSWGKG